MKLELKELKLRAFANILNQKMDVNGLTYVMGTGRMWATHEAEIAEALGWIYSKDFRSAVFRDLNFYKDFPIPAKIASKKRIMAKLDKLADKWSKIITDLYPLYKKPA